MRTDDEWIEDIQNLIEDVDEEDISIKGYGPKESTYHTEKSVIINMYDALTA